MFVVGVKEKLVVVVVAVVVVELGNSIISVRSSRKRTSRSSSRSGSGSILYH